MKKFTKLLGIVLIIALVMSMGITAAFAQTVAYTGTDGDGATITINNPAKGEDYTLYKLFDATVGAVASGATSTDVIAYQGTIPESLKTYFEPITGADGTSNYVKLKDSYSVDSMPEAFWTALETWAGTATATATATSNGDATLVFTDLPYGYYVIITSHKDSTTNKAAITVDSTNPNASIYDKNATTVVNEGKEADGTSYSIGDTITYTATFTTTNYYGSGSTAGQVYKYVIEDTLPEFLSDVTVTSITIGGAAYTVGDPAAAPQFDSNKQITIPWVDDNGASLYANGAKIIVTYTAKLTSTVNVNAANKNTISITPYDKDNKPYSEPFEKSAEITTYAAALKKTDGTKALAGAKFKFYGLTVTKTADGIYTVVSYDATAYDTTEGATQDETKLGTEMEVGSDGMLYVIGLGADDKPVGVETVAPDGYNKLTGTVTLTPEVLTNEVYKESGTRYYDADGNLVATEASSSSNKTVEKNLSELDGNAVEVVNQSGTELPSTGGIGTTIFYVVGSILVVAAGVLLVTKKRMGREG